MSDRPQPDPALLQRVLAPTPVGREELRDPQSGLSLPQRWLLGHIDGEQSLAALATQSGCPPAERLPRDAARLVSLGLALDRGEPGPPASTFGPSTMYGEITLSLPLDDQAAAAATSARPRRLLPTALAAAAVLAVGGGAAALMAGPSPEPAALPPAPVASAPAAAASVPASPVAGMEPVPDPELSASAVLEALTVAPRPAASAPPPPPLRDTQRPGLADVGRPAADPVPAAAPVPLPLPVPQAAPSPSPLPPPPSLAPTPVPAPAPSSPPPPSPGPSVVPAPGPAVLPTAPPPAVAVAPPAVGLPAPVALLRPLATVPPVFPREGLGLGSRAVLLQARLSIAPNGSVTQVNFAQSSAATRPFERAARTALLQWRFPEGSGERSYTQQLRFSEE